MQAMGICGIGLFGFERKQKTIKSRDGVLPNILPVLLFHVPNVPRSTFLRIGMVLHLNALCSRAGNNSQISPLILHRIRATCLCNFKTYFCAFSENSMLREPCWTI
jgi:hypothetical protein